MIFMPIGFVYTAIRSIVNVSFKKWWLRTSKYLYVISYSIDQLGNVVMQEMFNDILIRKGGLKFGNPDETISSVLGKNAEKNKLTFVGTFIGMILDSLDYNHMKDAIEADEMNEIKRIK